MESIVSYCSSDSTSTESSPVKSPAHPADSSLPKAATEIFSSEDKSCSEFTAAVAGVASKDSIALELSAKEGKSEPAGTSVVSTASNEKSCSIAGVESLALESFTETVTRDEDTADELRTAAVTGDHDKIGHLPTEITRRRPRSISCHQPPAKRSAACKKSYCIRYEGNGSKRWDRKQILVDRETLESVYNVEELVLGKEVVIPWPKKGEVQNWKGIIVDATGMYM